MGILGSGWLLAWQILAVVASLPMVWLMVLIQSAESIRPPTPPPAPSLGTFGVVMSAATYFAVAGAISGTWTARRAGARWSIALAVGIGASMLLALASYHAIYRMATVGGRAWVSATLVALAVMVLCVVTAPRWVEPP